MKTIIRKELRKTGISNGETLDHKTQIMLCQSCAGESIKKIEEFWIALKSMTIGNHIVNGEQLTLSDKYI